jgi:hypothetical protein
MEHPMQPMLTNSKVRKSLSDQIDRLDRILDGLADGLNEAVADAVKQGISVAVREAVQAVLSEVMTNPDLLGKLRATAPAAPPAAPVATTPTQSQAPTARLRALRGRLGNVLQIGMQAARWLAGSLVHHVHQVPLAVRASLVAVCRMWRPLVVAVGVGCLLGTAAYWAGPWLCTGAGGLAGFASTLALQARLALRRLYRTTAIC